MSCPFGYGSKQEGAAEKKEEEEENLLIAGTYYGEYLQLDKILTAQKPLSEEKGVDAHDEMLFIVTHQAYELWFKQILYEIDSIIDIMAQPNVPERDTATVAHRLQRVTEIQKILIDQIRVLETMLPLDFLDFRKILTPASGFQSVQFRIFENRLGMDPNRRINYMNDSYTRFFRNADQKELVASHTHLSLLQVLETWLERTPFVQIANFDFWALFQNVVANNLAEEKALIESLAPLQDPDFVNQQLKGWEKTKNTFDEIFDEAKYNESKARGDRRLSWKAMKAVLFINLYRDEPVLHLPFNILRYLTDIDELLTTWRYRHAMMVQRMIGMKVGTGGSSGYHYLKATVSDRYKVFVDLFTVSALLVPRSQLPVLPLEVQALLGFSYSKSNGSSSSSSVSAQ